MVFVRIAILAFLIAFGWSLGMLPSHELNAFGQFMGLTPFVTIPALYLLPLYEAYKRDHPKLRAIAILNVLLGWTAIGWVAALVWAYMHTPSETPAEPEFQAYGSANGPAGAPAAVNRSFEPDARESDHFIEQRDCPFCAEPIKRAAIKCKHCGSTVDPVA